MLQSEANGFAQGLLNGLSGRSVSHLPPTALYSQFGKHIQRDVVTGLLPQLLIRLKVMKLTAIKTLWRYADYSSEK